MASSFTTWALSYLLWLFHRTFVSNARAAFPEQHVLRNGEIRRYSLQVIAIAWVGKGN